MTLTIRRIVELLAPFVRDLPDEAPGFVIEPAQRWLTAPLIERLSAYLDLLLRWNARTNLTAIRDPEEIIQRHFGESLFLARKLCPLLEYGDSILDFGSGAGFPGIPLQLVCPEQTVLLAESQGKKATFLREAVRVLELKSEVWGGRVEDLPSNQAFSAVTLRAVDKLRGALAEARRRTTPTGHIALLGSESVAAELKALYVVDRWKIPESKSRVLFITVNP